MRLLKVLLLSLATLLQMPGLAAADPRAPAAVMPAPEGLGPPFETGIRTIDPLALPYVEEEYFVSGEVDVFTYADPPEVGVISPVEGAPSAYTTRIVIRRPRSARWFNGTLVLEWFNSTAGFDSAPAWDMSAEYFGRRGVVYVGVTVAPIAVDFLVAGCPLSVLDCGARYAALSLPEPGQAYEMVSQIVTLLRSQRAENPLPRGFRVKRLFHVGQSQQASDVTTYSREFHFELNDGYFMQAPAVQGKPLSTGSPLFGRSDLRGWPRTDLPVPVVRAQTETDLAFFPIVGPGVRQVGMDTPTFRYYELPGVAHNTVHEVEIPIESGAPIQLGDLCVQPSNTGADGPIFGRYVYNAIWHNMERQVRWGILPPHGEPMQFDGRSIVRDEFGNAVGGVRLPGLEVPLATYMPINFAKPFCEDEGAPDPPDCLPPEVPRIISLACLLSGSVEAFDRETLDTLYPTRRSYLWRVVLSAYELWREGFLLPADFRELVLRARDADVGEDSEPRRWRRHPRRRW